MKDRFLRRDQTTARMSDLAEVVILLRDRGYDLTALHTIDDLLATAGSAKVLLPFSQYHYVKDAWETPIVWRVSKASTGDVEVAMISCGKNRVFDQGEGDDIVFTLSLTGKGKGTLRYDSVKQADWPPTPRD